MMKELGSLQEKVLYFLAKNPKSHKQSIQKGIGYPAEQYGSVFKAVDSLEKIGYVASEKATSEKNNPINLYSCTEKGLIYALSNDPEPNYLKTLKAYEEKCIEDHDEKFLSFCRFFRSAYNSWGRDLIVPFFRDLKVYLPMIEKDGFEAAFPFMLLKMQSELGKKSPEEQKKIVRDMIKSSPEAKKFFEEMKKRYEYFFKGI